VQPQHIGVARREIRSFRRGNRLARPECRERLCGGTVRAKPASRAKPGQRISRIKTDAACDAVLLVLPHKKTLDAREMWEAPFTAARLAVAGSKSRDRGALGVSEFKRMARRVWPQ
jgi:hypothetical protein